MRPRTMDREFPTQAQPECEAAPLYRHTYRLKFVAENGRPEKHLEFEAEDVNQALVVASGEKRSRPFELWCDGRYVCSIAYNGEFWEMCPGNFSG